MKQSIKVTTLWLKQQSCFCTVLLHSLLYITMRTESLCSTQTEPIPQTQIPAKWVMTTNMALSPQQSSMLTSITYTHSRQHYQSSPFAYKPVPVAKKLAEVFCDGHVLASFPGPKTRRRMGLVCTCVEFHGLRILLTYFHP